MVSGRSRLPRSRLRQVLDLAATLLLFAALTLIVARLDRFAMHKKEGIPSVVDGDTLVLDGNKVRLQGIDAPEYLQMCQRPAGSYPCGREAKAFMVGLIGGWPVACEGWQTDKYQRLLVHCHSGTTDINREMVQQGWAVAYGDYGTEEALAKADRRGVWQGAFVRPSIYRQTKGDLVEPAESPHDMWFMLRQMFAALFHWNN